MAFANGNSFSLNGVDYGGSNYGVVIVKVGYTFPGFRVSVEPIVGGDGAASQGYHISHIIWNIRCGIEAAPGTGQTEKAALLIKMDNVRDALIAAHRAGMTDFAFDWLPNKTWQGRPYGDKPIECEMLAGGAAFDLQIVATNPEEVSG